MREIKKVEMSQVPNLDSKAQGKSEPQFCGEDTEQKVVKDLSSQHEVSGRSQVCKNTADNFQTDITFGLANPGAMESSDRFFKIAYDYFSEKGDPEAYPKACAAATSPEETRGFLSRELLS